MATGAFWTELNLWSVSFCLYFFVHNIAWIMDVVSDVK